MKGNTATSTRTAAEPFAEPWTAIVVAERTVAAHRKRIKVWPFVADAIRDARQFLDGAADAFAKVGEGTILTLWVPGLPTYGHDERPVAEQFREFQGRANAAGWRSTSANIEHGSGWVTFTHKDRQRAVVHLGVLTALDAARTPLFNPGGDPERIAQQLAEFHAATGVPYRATPGVAGIAVIRRYHETKFVRPGSSREEPRWMWENPPDVHTPGDIVWRRQLTQRERRRRFVLALDVNKQYLAALSAVSVSWGCPVATGAREFDPSAAGLWHIVAPEGHELLGRPDGTSALPTLLNPAYIGRNGSCWVTTPILAELYEHGKPAEILDSYTSVPVRRVVGGRELPGAGRWLREPAERLRDAIAQHGRPVGHHRLCDCPSCRMAVTLKMCGNEAVGLMATATARIRRYDVHCTVRDTARVGVLRKVWAAARRGWSPFRVAHDCLYYAADSPEPPAELLDALDVVTNGQIGRFKFEEEKSTTMADYLAAERRRNREKAARRG